MKLRFVGLLLALALVVFAIPTYASAETPVLKVWSFTNELPTMINDYYLADHPGEFEMEALAKGALRVLTGEEEARKYTAELI